MPSKFALIKGGPVVRTASPAAMREVNRSILLTLIRLYQPISRIALGKRTGFSFSNVNEIVKQLIEEELVTEQRALSDGRGRVPTELSLNDQEFLLLGVSVRPSVTTVSLAGIGGTIRTTSTFDTPASPSLLVSQIVAINKAFQSSVFSSGKPTRGVGVSFPGLIDAGSGAILLAPALPEYSGFPLAEELALATGVITLVENDCNLGAFAELWLSGIEGLSLNSFVFLEVGDVGVGGGIIMDGEVYRGHDLTYAAEFGHITIDAAGPRCSCGRSGCWEQYVCDRTTWQRYRPRRPFGPRAFSKLIHDAINGEAKATKALMETARYLSAGLSSIVCVINPNLIVLSGQITEAWPLIGPVVETAFGSKQFRIKIRVARLSAEELFLMGAVTIAISSFFGVRKLGILSPKQARLLT